MLLPIWKSLIRKFCYWTTRKKANIQLEKRIVGALTLYSIIVYIVGALILFFYYFPEEWSRRFLYLTPILVFPIILHLLRKILHWIFVKRIFWQDEKLNDLRTKKKETLEDVMNTQTYKKAKEILDRFDPLRFHRIDLESSTPTMSVTAQRLATPLNNVTRRRKVVNSQITDPPPSSPTIAISPQSLTTPLRPLSPPNQSLPYNMIPVRPPLVNGAFSAPGTPRLPRPILPRERSLTDRLIDALVGDGPERRMALVCLRCAAHNGMALAEEFPFLAFRCCYCGLFHPARQEKVPAPSSICTQMGLIASSDADGDSDSDTVSLSSQAASDMTSENLSITDAAVDRTVEQCEDKKSDSISLVTEAPDLLVEANRVND